MTQKDPRNRAKSRFPYERGRCGRPLSSSLRPGQQTAAPEDRSRKSSKSGSKRHGGAVLELVARGLIERRNFGLLDRADFQSPAEIRAPYLGARLKPAPSPASAAAPCGFI